MKKQEFCDFGALREIKNWPGYFLHISETGIDIYSTRHKPNSYYKMKLQVNTGGYLIVGLTRTDTIQKKVRLHRLIAETLIPNPHNLECVDHIDGNKLNNFPSNLQWITNRDNTLKANAMGLWGTPPKKYQIHHEDGRVQIIENARKFARDHGYDNSSIISIANGRRNRHYDIIKVITL
jgi:hypothetical protein